MYRQGHFARIGLYENDIATLMYYYKPDMVSLLQELRPYVSETDLTKLQAIVADLQQRTARLKQDTV